MNKKTIYEKNMPANFLLTRNLVNLLFRFYLEACNAFDMSQNRKEQSQGNVVPSLI